LFSKHKRIIFVSVNKSNAFRIPHSAFRIPHSAFRIPHSAFRIPHSAFRIPHSFKKETEKEVTKKSNE
jgi:hypothetical protein